MKTTTVPTNAAHGGIVGFAGSRHGSVPVAKALVSTLAAQGASFLVGCAPGVDHSFRQALVAYPSCTTVHCAFKEVSCWGDEVTKVYTCYVAVGPLTLRSRVSCTGLGAEENFRGRSDCPRCFP